jgi:hypothetical protein
MSDEAVAGSNPAANEVTQPVASEPVSAPEAAPAEQQQEAPKSAREALERTFAKLEAKPAEQPGEVKSDRARTPDGKFAPKGTEVSGIAQEAGAVKTEVAAPTAQITAPTRFSKEAQAEWAKAPPAVQQETLRAVNELTQGIEKYKAEAATFEPLKPYQEIAQKAGVKLEHAIANYVQLDHAWATDPVKGFLETCRKVRVDPGQLINAVVNGGQLQPQGPDPRDQHIQSLNQKVAQLESRLGEVDSTVKQTQKQTQEYATLAEVQKFASDKPYFSELIPDITQMIETGYAKDLSDAYEKASRLNPVVAEKIAADKAPKQPASNAKAALSIAGTPTGASNAQTKHAGSPREALQRAFARVSA